MNDGADSASCDSVDVRVFACIAKMCLYLSADRASGDWPFEFVQGGLGGLLGADMLSSVTGATEVTTIEAAPERFIARSGCNVART